MTGHIVVQGGVNKWKLRKIPKRDQRSNICPSLSWKQAGLGRNHDNSRMPFEGLKLNLTLGLWVAVEASCKLSEPLAQFVCPKAEESERQDLALGGF